MDMSLTTCCGCDMGTDIVAGYLTGIMFFPFFLLLKRLILGDDELVLLRLSDA